MTAERRKWWRKVALASVGGTVAVGGLFGIVRATSPDPTPAAIADDAAWTRAPAPPPAAPAVAEVERTPATPPGFVTPASATLPVPLPALPTVPTPAVPGALPAMPSVPAPAVGDPVAPGPRNPEAGLLGTDKLPLPPVPAVPAAVPTDPPKVPADAPKNSDAKPGLPAVPMMPPGGAVPTPPAPPTALPGLPAPPASTAEPPRAPALPTPPVVPPPAPTAEVPPPVKPKDAVVPAVPTKPDSGLKPAVPENTLNPASPPAPAGFPPAVPASQPPTGGRETPGTVVDRPKPADPTFGASDKFVFPVPVTPDPVVLTPRDPAMLNFKHAAAAAVIGGALLSAEQARSAALPPVTPPALPTVPVQAEDKDTEKLRTDLRDANKRIEALEDKVRKLNDLVTGKKDSDGTPLTSDPGAVEDIKRLKNRIADLEAELKSLRSQTTALRPTTAVPGAVETKPKGVVRVVNEYPVEISMVINDKSHRVAPNTKLDVDVPAGEFTYQLLQSGAAATRSVIKDKETVTLRIK